MKILKKTINDLNKEKLLTFKNKNDIDFYNIMKKFIYKNKLPSFKEIKNIFLNEDNLEFLYTRRQEYIKRCGYVILNDIFLKQLALYIKKNNINKVIDVGAGNGFLSHKLKYYTNNTIDIIALDTFKEEYVNEEILYFDIINRDAIEYVKNNNNENTLIILSWPSYNTDFALNIVEDNKKNPILYIGEEMYGCTANDDFFLYVSEKYIMDYSLEEYFISSNTTNDTPIIMNPI